MKMYMGHGGEPEDGAVLIFAHTAKEAKKIAWSGILIDLCDHDYTNLRVKLIRDSEWLRAERRSDTEPHIVDDPRSCACCFLWGRSEIGDDGLCDYCRGGYDDWICPNTGEVMDKEVYKDILEDLEDV